MLKTQKGLEMTQISNGLIKTDRCCLLLSVLFLYMLSSCQKNGQRNLEFKTDEPFQIMMNDSVNVDIEWYENGFVKSIVTKSRSGLRNGPQLEYYPNGVLKEKYEWKNGKMEGRRWIYNDSGQKVNFFTYIDGKRNGDAYEFSNNSSLKTHIVFKEDISIYVGYYEEGKKLLGTPYPVLKDEKIREDGSYNVKIMFPFPFEGEMEIYLRDTIKFKMEYIDKYKRDLTITNFEKIWRKYELLLEYKPAENDSLFWSEQVHEQTIGIK